MNHPGVRPKLVGQSVKRVEDPRLLTGQGGYVDDYQSRDLLHITLVRSTHAHAQIRSINTSAALAVPGVLGVYVGADVVDWAPPLRAPSKMRNYYATPIPLLAQNVVRYVGEPVAAVLAEDRYRAEDAARAIDVSYEELPICSDPVAAATADAPLLHPEAGTNVIVSRVFETGDADQALANAKYRLKRTFRFRRKAALAIEPRGYVADYDRGRRELSIRSATQVPGIVRDALSELLGLPGNSIRVSAPDVGGGFGSKASVYPEEVLVAALALRLGRPIKFICDRLEDLCATTQAFDERVEAEMGFDDEGRIVALSAEVLGDVGAYSVYPWTAALEPVQVVSFMTGPYRVPNYRGRVRGVVTPKAPMGPYRGVGRPISVLVTERLMDIAADAMGVDPVELRQRNLVQAEEFPYRAGSGIVWDGADFAGCMQLAKDTLDYPSARRRQRAGQERGQWIGIGFASYAELTGIGSKISAAPGMPVNTGTETATVRMDPSGTVTAIFGVASHGQGLETTLAQVVADGLGAKLEDIRIVHGDTMGRAYGTGTYASRSAVLAGGAATLAAGETHDRIMALAAHLLDAPVEDLVAEASMVSVPGTNRSVSFRELAQAAYVGFGSLPSELQCELEATRLYDPHFGTTSAATHAAIVEVDPDTYDVKILRYVVAEDCGAVINPMIVDGQVHGGVAQGIGAALFEEVVYDDSGQLLTGSLMEYLVPTASEIPPMEVEHVESFSPTTLGGFRGMGEGGTIGAPAALANAIADALLPIGVEVNEVPATPERLFQWISARNARVEIRDPSAALPKDR